MSVIRTNISISGINQTLESGYGDTASVTSSESTEANSDSIKADLGLCGLYVTGLFIDLYSDAKELQCCLKCARWQ